jgi:predicted anti-sigma-YlaC factor YlaD
MSDPNSAAQASFSIRCADAIELVTDYLDDALNTADLAVFEAHLDGCQGCTVFVDQIRMTIHLANAVNNERLDVMPADFDGLLDQLRAQTDREHPSE